MRNIINGGGGQPPHAIGGGGQPIGIGGGGQTNPTIGGGGQTGGDNFQITGGGGQGTIPEQ